MRLVMKDKFGMVIQTFAQNAARLMDVIESAFSRGDGEALAAAAHSLKSSSGQLGAVNVQRLVGALEEAVHDGKLAAAGPLVVEARAEFVRAMAELEQLAK
jgi:HPt (histidine-containing phosphotransfer) domain-containing protein